jgi:threonine/homoserine/homoserine lactone efflux protein
MVPADRLLTFAAAAFVLIVIPGPSVLFEISRSVALGRRAGLATVVGNAAGEVVQALAVAIGIGSIIQRSEPLFTVVKVLGVGCIILLGIRAIRDRLALSVAFAAGVVPRSDRRVLFEGFIVGATNPKSLVRRVGPARAGRSRRGGLDVAARMYITFTRNADDDLSRDRGR